MRVFIIIATVLLSSSLVYADDVVLVDGTKFKGNILDVDKQNGILKFDVVLDRELIGLIMTFNKDEMIYINRDNKYKDLVRTELSIDEKKVQEAKLMKRMNSDTSSTDYRIQQRLNREIEQNREDYFIEEAKKENEKERAHKLEVERIRAQAEVEAAREADRVEQQRINLYKY